MKDDYLWDKSGQPDPEIEHLERVLSQLRSNRSAQELMPAFEKLPRNGARSFTKWLAVAATLAFTLVALGIFGLMQRQAAKQEASDSQLSMANPVAPASSVKEDATANVMGEAKQAESAPFIKVEAPAMKPRRSPQESRLRTINRRRVDSLSERERSEGLLAKEQLLKALEITSSSLDFVQKKVQGEEKQGPSS